MTQLEMKPVAISVRTAGQLSGLGRTRLYELMNAGRLASVSVGRRRLISLASLEDLLSPQYKVAAGTDPRRAKNG